MSMHEPIGEPHWHGPCMVATAVTIGAVIVREENAAWMPNLVGSTSLLLQLEIPGAEELAGFPLPAVILDLSSDLLNAFAAHVRGAVDTVVRSRQEAIPVVRCPGCNQQLHGDVAVRGACFGCFPKLEDGEVALNGE